MASASTTLSYHEPELPHLLLLLTFLYLLYLAGKLADHLLYAGLLGQIALGTIMGSPLGGVLDRSWEETWMDMGYVGLIGIVFQGGLETDPSMFGRTIHLALVGAVSGVLLPIAFSFALLNAAFKYETIHSFVVGCALSSTSLGTTLFVLQSQSSGNNHESNVGKSEFGSVLMGAALIDDVIALVLLSVVKSLPTDPNAAISNLGWIIGKPIVASLGMAIISPCLTFFIIQPLHQRYTPRFIDRIRRKGNAVDKRNKIQGVMFFIALCVLSAHLAVSYYIGTTSLLGAFLAGVMLSSVPVHLHKEDELRTIDHLTVFRDYAGPVQDHVLAPLFFASIGYTIPFLSLFKSTLIWQGVVYSVFMCVGKVLVGFVVYLGFEPILSLTGRVVRGNRTLPTKQHHAGEHDLNRIETEEGRTGRFEDAPPEVTPTGSSPLSESIALPARPSLTERVTLGAALGTALVARGEIGILILQVAYSKSQLAFPEAPETLLSEDVYLIGIWAVALCTIVGPVAFAGLMRSERFRACIS